MSLDSLSSASPTASAICTEARSPRLSGVLLLPLLCEVSDGATCQGSQLYRHTLEVTRRSM